MVDRVSQPHQESSNSIHPLWLVAAPIAKDVTGVEEGTRYRSHACTLEAWVCSGCGFVEWYGKELAELERLSRHHDGGVRRARSKAAPVYR